MASPIIAKFDVPIRIKWFEVHFTEENGKIKMFLDNIETPINTDVVCRIPIIKIFDGQKTELGTVSVHFGKPEGKRVVQGIQIDEVPLREELKKHADRYCTWEVSLGGSSAKLIYDKIEKKMYWREQEVGKSDIDIPGMTCVIFELEGHHFNMTAEGNGTTTTFNLHQDNRRVPQFVPRDDGLYFYGDLF